MMLRYSRPSKMQFNVRQMAHSTRVGWRGGSMSKYFKDSINPILSAGLDNRIALMSMAATFAIL